MIRCLALGLFGLLVGLVLGGIFMLVLLERRALDEGRRAAGAMGRGAAPDTGDVMDHKIVRKVPKADGSMDLTAEETSCDRVTVIPLPRRGECPMDHRGRPQMHDLQALVTGYIAMALDQAAHRGPLRIEVSIANDEHGYLPEVLVRGLISHELLRVRVEVLEAPKA